MKVCEVFMELTNESKTLFIPLYARALMSKENLFLKDLKAEEIINKVNYHFDELNQSKWLSMYLATRTAVLDRMVNDYIRDNKKCTIIHLGCGLDSRCQRVNQDYGVWYDLDFTNVIHLRKQFFQESDKYKMIGKSITDLSWLDEITVKNQRILIVAEGLFMYLSEEEIKLIIKHINDKLGDVTLLFDSYSKLGVKLSNYKNPVNQVDANIRFGMKDETDFLRLNSNLLFIREAAIKYENNQLKGMTRWIFNYVYCGKFSESLYKIYKFYLVK